MNDRNTFWFTWSTRREMVIRNGKSARKASEKSLLIMKPKIWLHNSGLNKLLPSSTSPNLWWKSKSKKLSSTPKILSGTSTTKFPPSLRTLLFLFPTTPKCKNWHPFPSCKENTSLSFSTKTKSPSLIEFFPMMKIIRRTSSSSEWRTLRKLS